MSALAQELRRVAEERRNGNPYAGTSDLLDRAAAALEAPAVPDWVGGFLNRRTEVETILRAPAEAVKKGMPLPEPLTPEEMNALADRLSVPDEFMSGVGR